MSAASAPAAAPVQPEAGVLPEFDGALDDDARRLADSVRDAEAMLAALPDKPERSAEQQARAARMLEQVRTARARFMRRHAESVYDALTAGRSRHRRLPELVAAAGERFPGLVPAPAIMAAERARIQAHKDGCDIDLGLLVRALLLAPAAGGHLLDAMLRPTERALTLLARFRAGGHVDLGSVSIERRGRAAHLTIRNLDCLNAEDAPLAADLETAADLALLDAQVGVGVLRGAVMTHPKYAGRRVFCSGINLRALRDGEIGLVDFLLAREMGLIQKLRRGLLVEPHRDGLDRFAAKPWIAAVDGFAIGGGMQLLFAFDHVIAEEQAWFSLPAAQEGIVPGVANLRITRQTGSRLARRVILGGRRVLASDPDASTICDEVAPAAAMQARIDAAVRALDSPAVVANRTMLALAEERSDDFRLYMAEFALMQARRAHSADVIERLERAWAGQAPGPA